MKWISVTERLPKDGAETLIYCEDDIFIAEFGIYADAGGSWTSDGEVWFPSHWMPLPEPPV